MDCLENVIRLSRTDCGCSLQGLQCVGEFEGAIYLDELDGITSSDIKDVYSCGDICNSFDRLKARAIAQMQSSLDVAVLSNNTYSMSSFIHDIGENTVTGTYNNLTSGYYGMKIKPTKGAGSVLNIDGVQVQVNGTSARVLIVRDNDKQIIIDKTETVTPLVFSTIETNVRLPLYNYESEEAVTYMVLVECSGSGYLVKNKIHCGCSGVLNKMHQFYEITSVQADGDYNDTNTGYGNIAFGLKLKQKTTCTLDTLVCDNYEQSKRLINVMYSYHIAVLFVKDAIKSNNLKTGVLADRENLFALEKYYKNEISNLERMLLSNIDINKYDCIHCNNPISVTRKKIWQ